MALKICVKVASIEIDIAHFLLKLHLAETAYLNSYKQRKGKSRFRKSLTLFKPAYFLKPILPGGEASEAHR